MRGTTKAVVRLSGRTAVITGASRGIGLGIARVFASAGLNVMITGRHREPLLRAQSSMRNLSGEVEIAVADVTNFSEMHAVATQTVRQFGGIDILCVNAGIYPRAPLQSVTSDELHEMFSTNMYGTVYATQACLPALEMSPCGRLVVISSITGTLSGYPQLTPYAASKAAQVGFVRSAAVELAPKGITVNAVLPGTIRESASVAAGSPANDRLLSAIPAGRFGSPEDIGHAALFLASPDADFITGQLLVVDGGQTLPEVPGGF